MSDNKRVDVTSDTPEDLKLALQLLWPDCPIVGYQIVKPAVDAPESEPATLVLYTQYHKDATACAFEHDFDHALAFITGWLQKVEYPDDNSDNDGLTLKGWRLFNEQYGYVHNKWEACIGIQPIWHYYSK